MTAADCCVFSVEKKVTNWAPSLSTSVKTSNRRVLKFSGSQSGSFAADICCSVNTVISVFTQTNLSLLKQEMFLAEVQLPKPKLFPVPPFGFPTFTAYYKGVRLQ